MTAASPTSRTPYNTGTTPQVTAQDAFIFENIQIVTGALGNLNFSAGVLIRKCVLVANNGGHLNFNSTSRCENCLFLVTSGSNVFLFQGSGGVIGSTFITDLDQIAFAVQGSYQFAVFANNVAINRSVANTADPWPGSIPTNFYAATCKNNATSNASIGNCPGTGPLTSATAAVSLVGPTDARPKTGSPLLGAGSPISGWTTDFYGAARSGSTPSIGAGESAPTATLAPVFSLQPVSQTVTAGASVTFVAAASDTVAWQWYKNGTVIAGASSSSYTFSASLPDSGAAYTVLATGPTSLTTLSTSATLTVNPAADVTAPTLTGTIGITSRTTTGLVATCPVGTDAVGVVEYRWGLGATPSSWNIIPSGGRVATISGQPAGSTIVITFQCRDAANNWSASLSQTEALTTTSVTLGPFSSSGILMPAGTVVYYTWLQGGRIGDPPAALNYGTVTTTVDGYVTITGLPLGKGLGFVSQRGSAVESDSAFGIVATVA